MKIPTITFNLSAAPIYIATSSLMEFWRQTSIAKTIFKIRYQVYLISGFSYIILKSNNSDFFWRRHRQGMGRHKKRRPS
jgi:hypothetical protein